MSDAIAWLLEELDDKRFYEYLNEKKLELQKLQGEMDAITPIIKAMEFEAEMRRIAGGYEELKEFRSKLKLRKKEPVVTAHYLLHGLPMCGFTTHSPDLWPEGHKWLDVGAPLTAFTGFKLCEGCLKKSTDLAAQSRNYFLNEAHELPRITKYQSRKLREGAKYKKELASLEEELKTRHGGKHAVLSSKIRTLKEEIRKCDVAAKGKNK